MTFEEVKELIDKIDNSTLKQFELNIDNVCVKMSKTDNPAGGITVSAPLPHPQKEKEVFLAEKKEEEPVKKEEEKGGNIVKSPIVGVFYSSQAEDKPPLIHVGDTVKQGDLLCIVGAMKIMNEITSPYDGKVAEIFVSNEELVEYGQPLFRIV